MDVSSTNGGLPGVSTFMASNYEGVIYSVEDDTFRITDRTVAVEEIKE